MHIYSEEIEDPDQGNIPFMHDLCSLCYPFKLSCGRNISSRTSHCRGQLSPRHPRLRIDRLKTHSYTTSAIIHVSFHSTIESHSSLIALHKHRRASIEQHELSRHGYSRAFASYSLGQLIFIPSVNHLIPSFTRVYCT